MARQSYLATDHKTRFEISADGKTCRMQVLTTDDKAMARGELDFRWQTIVWFRDCGRPPGIKGPEVTACPYCLMPDPPIEHVKNCLTGHVCTNCRMVAEAHSAKARRDAKAHGFLMMACEHFTGPEPSQLGPALRAVAIMKAQKVDQRAAGQDDGKRGKRARAELRNIKKPKPPRVRMDARGRKIGRNTDTATKG